MTAHSTSDFVTALCNQPEAFASYLSDGQSHYLLNKVYQVHITSLNDLKYQLKAEWTKLDHDALTEAAICHWPHYFLSSIKPSAGHY